MNYEHRIRYVRTTVICFLLEFFFFVDFHKIQSCKSSKRRFNKLTTNRRRERKQNSSYFGLVVLQKKKPRRLCKIISIWKKKYWNYFYPTENEQCYRHYNCCTILWIIFLLYILARLSNQTCESTQFPFSFFFVCLPLSVFLSVDSGIQRPTVSVLYKTVFCIGFVLYACELSAIFFYPTGYIRFWILGSNNPTFCWCLSFSLFPPFFFHVNSFQFLFFSFYFFPLMSS